MTRIRKFLLLDEIQEENVSHDHDPDYVIKAENVSLGWSLTEANVKNLSLEIKKGKLVASSNFFSNIN